MRNKFQFHRNYLTKIGNNAHIKHGAIDVMLPSYFLSRLRFISFIVKKESGQGWLPVTCKLLAGNNPNGFLRVANVKDDARLGEKGPNVA